MNLPSLKEFSPKELLQLDGKIIDELVIRGIVRTRNKPVGGFTEWLVSEHLALTLSRSSEQGFNATDKNGAKYEIKARQVTASNKSRELSAFRDLTGKHFDVLVAVVYDETFEIILALKIPYAVVVRRSSFVPKTNSYKLMAEDGLKNEPGVEDLTQLLR